VGNQSHIKFKAKQVTDMSIDKQTIEKIIVDHDVNRDGYLKKIWRTIQRLVRGKIVVVLLAV